MEVAKTQAGEVFQNLKAYDEGIRKIIPHYDLVLDEITRQIPSDSRNILELGSGTGGLSLRILQHCPEANLLTVDYSDRMNAFFAEKLASQESDSRVKMIYGDLANFEAIIDDGMEGLFDACVSSFTIHHLTDPVKKSLISAISQLLRPGAGLWIADSMLPESSQVEGAYKDARSRWMKSFEVEEGSIIKQMVLPKPFGKSDDHFHSTLSTYIKYLESAGFESVFIPFKFYAIAVCGGTLPK